MNQYAFRNLPIFITTMSRWDGDVSSASLALAKVLSRTNPVYYIDYPYSLLDVWRERSKPTEKRRLNALLFGKDYLTSVPGQPEKFVAVTPRAVLPIYSLPEGSIYEWANRYNSHRIASVVEKICNENGYRDYLFLNSFNPAYLSAIGQYMKPSLSIYHSRDAIEEVPGHGLRKENVCVRNYDLPMATSRQLCRKIGERNHRPIAYFPNGGDVHLFRKAVTEELPLPEEIADIRTPIIGYTGAVCQRIDYELIVKILKANPDKTLVIVGPRKDHEFTDIKLDEFPNVRFVFARPIEALPQFLKYFDCTIIPFKKNNLTGGIYPLKINEYLAAGRSVITTDFSEDIRSFSEHVFLAKSHDEFLEMIPQAIVASKAGLESQRFEAALSNSWENRADLFWELAYEAYLQKEKRLTERGKILNPTV